MAVQIPNFIPELWSAEILVPLRNVLIYGGPGVSNRDYEGMIRQQGDTVHILSIGEITIRSYTAHGTISWETLTDDDRTLIIDQADYFAFKVDDIEKAQAINGFIQAASEEAARGLAEEVDTYVSTLMVDAVDGGAQDLGLIAVDISDNSTYGLLLALRAELNSNGVPAAGRWVVVPTAVYGALLSDARFVDASASGSTAALREGQVGRAAGFDVFESQTVPQPTAGTYHILAGHRMATTFADQIPFSGGDRVEAIRLENQFGDGIRGLHLYGAKVVRPEALALASVTVAA